MNIADKLKERVIQAKGMILAEVKIVDDRIKECNSCEHLSSLRACKKCGCFVDAKTKLKFTSCPIGKW
jgi:hypothetical protein